jgi:hypothetical protein
MQAHFAMDERQRAVVAELRALLPIARTTAHKPALAVPKRTAAARRGRARA